MSVASNPIVEVKDLVKVYKQRKSGEQIRAVDKISFQVKRGEMIGLLGPNGAGKTTTIKMICGLLMPDQGAVYVNQLDIHRQRHKALTHISAVLEGNRNLYWRLTVKENLEYFAGNRGLSRKEAAHQNSKLLDMFRLQHKENELVQTLSRGMQQKLAIAVAMAANSDVILLDEPTLGLDVETGYEVRELLKQIVEEEKRTVIISTHDMPVVQELCSRTIIINSGKVVVDDQVSNLLKLFETRAYAIHLGKALTQEQLTQLSRLFPLSRYQQEGMSYSLEVNLEQEEDIYELMEILKLDRTPVESIDRVSIDFEQVFRQIVNGGSGETYALA